jgi:adenylosuccinate synthase
MYNGVKHIHSNFGSGSLRGVPTYFSEHTTIYPVTIARELKVLKGKGVEPELTIHPLAMITTPYDVYANRVDVDNLSHGNVVLVLVKQ